MTLIGAMGPKGLKMVVINAYKFTVFEICGEFFVLSYIACLRYI